MIKEHERVALSVDLPQYHLKAGDLGVVVMIHGDHDGYELELFSADGQTLDVVTVEARQVRPVTHRDVMRARTLESVVARTPAAAVSLVWALLAFAIVIAQGSGSAFIYFQF